MASLHERADRLSKRLHPHLTRKLSFPHLKKLGWFDFLNTDRPLTEDPVEMACAAFLYLGIDTSGRWNGNQDLLVAMVSFLRLELGLQPAADQLVALKGLLEQSVVDRAAVERWFSETYATRRANLDKK